ncbi:MAG: hypothetical protein FJ100_16825 [Deltaproteobacteria bacterium]|nr:hypothetical protein [Deltaproteobacteria bacterium]
MKKPDASTVTWYEANVPVDPRAVRGQMFGHPCAFVNGNLFFGTFEQTLIARVGTDRAAALAQGGVVRVFEPMAGRPWKDYVQIAAGQVGDAELRHLVKGALDHTARLAPKVEKKAKAKKA